MSLTVIGFSHSPFCIAVEKILNAIGAEYASKEIPAWDRREVLKLTAGQAYEVPLLLHDCSPIYETAADSQDIAAYIDRHFASGCLFPEDLKGLHEIVIRYLESEVEDVTFRIFDPYYIESIEDVGERGMVIRHKERKFGRGCVDRWRRERDELMLEAERLLRPLNARLETTGAFLFGDDPVFADFLLGGILGNLTYSGFNQIPAGLKTLKRFRALVDGFSYSSR